MQILTWAFYKFKKTLIAPLKLIFIYYIHVPVSFPLFIAPHPLFVSLYDYFECLFYLTEKLKMPFLGLAICKSYSHCSIFHSGKPPRYPIMDYKSSTLTTIPTYFKNEIVRFLYISLFKKFPYKEKCAFKSLISLFKLSSFRICENMCILNVHHVHTCYMTVYCQRKMHQISK